MQMILPQSNAQDVGCQKAVAPVIAQGQVLFDAAGPNTGSAQVAMTVIPAGEDAPYGGTMHNKGCQRVSVLVIYLEGDDCDPCTSPDTLTRVNKSFCMQPYSTYEVPPGFWTEIYVNVVKDDCSSPADLQGTQKQSVFLHSGYKPACVTCKVVVPA